MLLLGRYNNCKPKELRELQEAFPSLKLRFKSAHASKGLEDDYVVVLELKAERMGFPTGMVDDPLFDLVLAAPEFLPNAEERRLFYVALTHARRAVFLLADRSSPSPFVVELESGGYDVEIYGGNGQADDRCPNCKEEYCDPAREQRVLHRMLLLPAVRAQGKRLPELPAWRCPTTEPRQLRVHQLEM